MSIISARNITVTFLPFSFGLIFLFYALFIPPIGGTALSLRRSKILDPTTAPIRGFE